MQIKRSVLPVLLSMLMVFTAMTLAAETAYAAIGSGNTSVRDAVITISPLTYNGYIQKPEIKLVIGQVTLVEGTDYDLEYHNMSSINAGRYRVTIRGKGIYSGKTIEHYTIEPKKITPEVTLSNTAFVYNGAIQAPDVTAVMDDTVKLTETKDYRVSYDSVGKDVGSYDVTVTLRDNYSGSAKFTYTISPKGTGLKSLTGGSKLLKVKWEKQTEQMSTSEITGYQLKLATDRAFTKNKKTVTVKGFDKASKKVTKLKGGKKYYVKIRTYKTVDGKKYYSGWSETRTKKTKK